MTKPRPTIRGSGIHDSGYLVQGNIDLNNRPRVKNADGSISTVRSGSYENNAGQEVLIPTISNEGKTMSMPEAMQYWGALQQFLGKFASPDQADAYAIWLHNQQAQQYGAGLQQPRRGLRAGVR
jgi:hypothetical protein